MKTKNAIIVAITLFLAFSIHTVHSVKNHKSFSINDEWKIYKSEESKCQISFPMEFTEEKKGDQTTLQCMMGTQAFMFFHAPIKGGQGTDVTLAEEALKAFNKSMKGKIKKENAYNFNEFKGKKATIYLKDKKLYAHYIVIIGREVLYQIVALTTAETPNDDVVKFFKSFIILS